MSPMHAEHSPDESVHGAANGNVNVNRFILSRDTWQWINSAVCAAAVLAIIIVSYLLHDAYRDIQTQVWLKQDKEEEKFQKFVAGPYAQLAGELRANEILFDQCKEKRK